MRWEETVGFQFFKNEKAPQATAGMSRSWMIKPNSTGVNKWQTLMPLSGSSIGVFAGVSYTASDGSYVYSQYWPTGTTATNIVAYIYDDPYTVFKCQSAGTPAQTNIGNACDVVAGAGSTTTGQSGFELSGTMSTGTASCKIIALYDSPENAFGANAVMEVLINEHLLKDGAGI